MTLSPMIEHDGADGCLERRKPILIAIAGATFEAISAAHGDFADWIARGLGAGLTHQRIDARHATNFPSPGSLAGVVVSGSHAMVTEREPWSERLGAWMRSCVEANVPVLGICYGHQLLAHAFGGQVGYLPRGAELGTRQVHLTASASEDRLMAGLPSSFPAHMVHYQSVLKLPNDATLLAFSEADPHQAFRVGSCGWGVQFHPEFSRDVMAGYLAKVHDTRTDAETLRPRATSTSEATRLLARFAQLVQGSCEHCSS